MKTSRMLGPVRMKRRLKRLGRGAGRDLLKRRRPQRTGLARITSLPARMAAALRRLVRRLAGRPKVTVSGAGAGVAPRARAAVAAVPAIWSHREQLLQSNRERLASMAHRRNGDAARGARPAAAARAVRMGHRATAHEPTRRPRALVEDAVNRLATRGR